MIWDDLEKFCRNMKSKNKKGENLREKYWKLKQMDRIEYSLHLDKIISIHRFYFISILYAWVVLYFFLSVLGMLFYIGFEKITIINLLLIVKPFVAPSIVIVGIIDIFTLYRRHKKINHLKKRFNLK